MGPPDGKQTLPVIDGLLAATALEFNLTVVTRNTVDFEPSGVRLVNPFAQGWTKRSVV